MGEGASCNGAHGGLRKSVGSVCVDQMQTELSSVGWTGEHMDGKASVSIFYNAVSLVPLFDGKNHRFLA